MAALPTATVNGQQNGFASVLLNGDTALSVGFANASTDGAAGYQPFVTLILPSGVTFDAGSATYLGLPVATQVLTVPASGTLTYAVADRSFTLTGLIPGSSIAVLQPPFGSFTPGETPADIELNLHVAADAPVGTPIAVTATAGFAWGGSATGADAPILQSAATADPDATFAITPTLLSVASAYVGPQDEMATGPALQAIYGGAPPASDERFDITSTLAGGQTLTDFTLSDPLPPSATVTDIQLVVGGVTYSYTIDSATGVMTQAGTGGPPVLTDPSQASGPYVLWNAATNTVTADFGVVTGNGVANGGPEIKAFFNVGLNQGLGTATESATSTATPLIVTDMLPYGAVAQGFTLTGIDGVTYTYSVDPTSGVMLISGDSATAPTQASSAATIGSGQFYYDVANGNITADFGLPTAAGQTATITAQWSGGQYQLPGVASATSSGGDLALVDQLNGAATADSFTITTPDGVATYVYDSATDTLNETGAAPADGAVAGSQADAAAAGAAVSTVYYDLDEHRIVADFRGLAAGAAATIEASFSGGQTVSQATAANYTFSNAASASGNWAQSRGVAQTATSGPDVVTAKAVTLQKGVSDASAAPGTYHPIQPGDQLDWTLTAQVSNYFDLGDVTIHDRFSDGQHFDAAQPVTLTVDRPGQAAITLTLAPGEYTLNATANADGSTDIVFDISKALADAGVASDLNGGAALDDATPSTAGAPTLSLSYATLIDPSYKLPPANGAPDFLEQGDDVTNAANISGVVLDANGNPTSVIASDGSGNGVMLTTGSVLKTLYAVTRDGVVIWQADANNPQSIYTGLIQTGDDVTYHLVYNLPITHAADVTLTDFLPLPVYLVNQPNGVASGGGGYQFSTADVYALNSNAALPADGVIEYTNGSLATPYLANAAHPTLTTDAAANSFTLDFGAADASDATGEIYPNTNIDVVYTTKVQDSVFGDGLQLTNLVTGTEMNTAGAPTVSNAYAQMQMAAPQLRIEKAVVATTDPHGVFRDANGNAIASSGGAVTLGGVAWTLGAGTPFAGTLDSASGLASDPVADTLTDIGGGETMRYALVVENTGHDSNGAYDVTLHDTAIPAGLSLVAGSIHVYDGAGNQLSFAAVGGGLFDPNGGITVQDDSGLPGQAMGPNASDGSNVFVVTYDLQTAAAIATPLLDLPDTASLTSFSEQEGGVNRLSTIPAGDASASSAVITAPPVITKQVVATSDSATGADAAFLKIGESVTYAVTVTLPGGTASHVVLADLLPPQLALVSATIAAVGGDITDSAGLAVGQSSATGTFDLGAISVASDARNAADQITVLATAVVNGASTAITPGANVINVAAITEDAPSAPGTTLTQTASAAARIAAPDLTLTKLVRDDSVSPTGAFGDTLTVQAGDTLEYKVDLTDAAATANAYQVAITDALNAAGTDALGGSDLTLIAGSVVVQGGVASAGTLDATAATLAAGGTLELDFKAVVSPHATFAAAITNTAQSTAQTLANDDAAYPLGDARTLTNTAAATVTIAQPSVTKTLTAGSDSHIALPYLAVGETGTFTIATSLPEGDSTDLRIVDTLPTGLAYAGFTAPVLSGATAADATPLVSIAGNQVTLDFGAAHAGAGGGTISVGVNALVLNDASTPPGATLINTATVISNGISLADATAMATVAAPDLVITKTANIATGQAGDVVTYTLTIADASGDSDPAYGLDVTDAIQPGLTLLRGSEQLSGGDAGATNTVTDTGSGLEVTSSRLTGAAPLVITFQAALSDDDINGQVVANVAGLTYATAPSGGATLATQSMPADVTVALTDSVVKTLASGGANALSPAGVAPGQQVTFDVTATLGHGAQNLTLNDALPSGLDYVSSSVVSLGGVTGSALAIGQSGSFFGNTVSFALGNVDSPGASSSSQVMVAITATVDAADAPSTPAAPDLITNVGTLIAGNPTGSPYTSTNPLNETLTSPLTVQVVPDGTIEGRVFVNDACDGLYHVGDATVAGVTVNLIDSSGATRATTSTDNDGNYSFGAVGSGSYTEQFVLPSGLSFTEKMAGDAASSSAVNPSTGETDPFAVAGSAAVVENAGVYLNGNFAGETPTQIGAAANVSENTGGQIVVGTGNDNVHTNAGDNVILLGSTGSEGGDVVETGPGTDIVYTCGTGGTNAQALGASDYIFGGGGGVLQGGSGADYLMAGPGDYTLAGGAGASTLVSGPNDGTVTSSGGMVTNDTVGDEIRPGSGATTILFQKGDGVDLLDTFKPGKDTLTIYGYAGAQSISRVNGHTVLWLAANDAIVFNDVYAANADGSSPGIAFVPTVPAAPQVVLHFDANGLPYFAAPSDTPTAATTSSSLGANLPTLTSPSDSGTLVGSGSGQRLIAGNGAFTLVGGDGQDVFIGGTGSDVILAHGTGNTAQLGDGANTVVGGTSQTTATAGDGNDVYWLSGSGNAVTSGNGNNVVILLNGATGDVTLGNGANLVFAYGGSGDTIDLGTGDNTVFAQVNDSTIHLGGGNAFVFGTGNTVKVDSPAGGVLSIQGTGQTTQAGNGDLLLFQTGGTVDVGTGSHQLFVTGPDVSITAQGSNAILGPTGNATLAITGSGTQLIGLSGTGNSVSVQNGNATIFAGQGHDTVTIAGTGQDVVVLGAGDSVHAGNGGNQLWLAPGGSDRVVLAAQSTANDLYGFQAGDVLDLSAVLASAKADLTRVGSYVTATQSGSDTLIGLNASGLAGGAVTTIADLHGISVSFAQLNGHGELAFAA